MKGKICKILGEWEWEAAPQQNSTKFANTETNSVILVHYYYTNNNKSRKFQVQ